MPILPKKILTLLAPDLPIVNTSNDALSSGAAEFAIAEADCQFVYLNYGKKNEYIQEARFSILSLLHHTKLNERVRILLYTDTPEAFAGWPVQCVALSPAVLEEWTGSDGYLHRRKACAIADAITRAGKTIFVDSDTFFLRDALPLFDAINEQRWLIDVSEGPWGAWDDQPLYHAVAERVREVYGADDSMTLINSGVLGLPRSESSRAKKTVALVDELYPLARDIHVVEQFAVSVACHDKKPPTESRKFICHYFSGKHFWRRAIATFFACHGEEFSTGLVNAFAEVPKNITKPSVIKRVQFKLASVRLGLDKRQLKAARFAMYAAGMPDDVYAQSFARGYIESLKRNVPEYFDAWRDGRFDGVWSRLFSGEVQKRLRLLLQSAE